MASYSEIYPYTGFKLLEEFRDSLGDRLKKIDML